jgi:hypothetical protein
MPKINGRRAQSLLQKAGFGSVIAPAFAQGAESLYAGKQPQILMKFALTLCGALS